MNKEMKNSCVTSSDFVRVEHSMDSDVIARPSISYWKDVWRRLKTDKVAIICMVYLIIVIAMAVLAPMFCQYAYDSTDLSHLNEGPTAAHWFGTDQAGRDLWARIWVGARISLLIGFGGAVVPMIVGTLIGGISGYFGGWVDMVIMRIIDVGACIPDLVYITLIMLFLGAGLGSIVIAIAISGWMGTARSVRGRMLQFKNREFVLASRTLGGSGLHQIFSSILPHILGQQVVSLTSMIPAAIFMEAYLSFIGLGVASPMTSWGQLAQTGQKVFRQYPYQLFIPGVIISVTILAFYLFGNSLRDAMDPHLRN